MPPKKIIKLDPKQTKLSFGNVSDRSSETNPHEDARDHSKSTDNNENKSAKKKDRHFQQKWLQTYSWLRYDQEKQFMYCELCENCNIKCSMVKAAMNTNFQHTTLVRHAELPDHQRCLQAPSLKKDMISVTNKVFSSQDKAVMTLFKTIEWIVKEDIPLHKFHSLVQLLHHFDVKDLGILQKTKINYESQFTVNEFLDSLSQVVEMSVNKAILASPYVTVLSDESTDISNTKRQVIYVQTVNENFLPETHYICNLECQDASGVGIANAILNEMDQRGVKPSQIMSLGSDGASAMTGKEKGAAAIMKRANPHMNNVHCIAHRLALCTSQAAEKLPLLKKHQQILSDLFYYFKGSGKREARLHEIQEVVDDPRLTIKEVHAVRWLSYFNALTAVYRSLDSLLTYFCESSDKDYKATSLRKKIATDTFIETTYMMMDAMAPITILSQFFQTENIDVALVKVQLEECVKALDKMKKMDTPYLTKLKEDLQGDKYKGHHVTLTNFNLENLMMSFIDELTTNINRRFPMSDLLGNFAVLGMRPISFLNSEQLENYGNDEIAALCEFYGHEQTVKWKETGENKSATSAPIIDSQKTKDEWVMLKKIVLAEKYPRDSMKSLWSLIHTYHKDAFPNMIKLGALALTSAVHTAGCERGFSVQNKILIKSRCRLSVETQHKLMMIKLKSGSINFDEAVKLWKSKKDRRLYELK